MLLAVPVPEADSVPADEIWEAIEAALARAASMRGAAITPFVLEQIADITGGRSITANLALAENNASVAAQIAVALARQDRPG
jgi:pseudouridine-5'-phosphate glycosidase